MASLRIDRAHDGKERLLPDILSGGAASCQNKPVIQREYIRNVEGALRVGDTRVSLDSIVYFYREGESPESIADNYPALTLEQIYGAIAYYLANKQEIDAWLAEGERAAESQHRQSRQTNAELIARLQRARHANQTHA